MTSNAALILTSTLFVVVLVTMIVLIVYSYSVKNKLKKCTLSCNDGNCSVLPTGIYTIQAGGVSLLQANDGDLGYVYVGSPTDNVNSTVTLVETWNVVCLPSQTSGQSLIALFNTQPDGQSTINALQQNKVNENEINLLGSKMSTSAADVDPTFAQWMNVIPQSGGYQLMSSGRYLALRDTPVNNGTLFSTSLTASPDAVWDILANFTTDWNTIFTFSPVG